MRFTCALLNSPAQPCCARTVRRRQFYATLLVYLCSFLSLNGKILQLN
uniref:Uncharacterized protein n=1 Tax=Myoviridae sp. ctOAa14 TaxID=2826646 RepID=A0A8S5MQM2_9CAUD|nr:MAG TPA: hypothetical protein [Myoviridae sp. ctOAa14]